MEHGPNGISFNHGTSKSSDGFSHWGKSSLGDSLKRIGIKQAWQEHTLGVLAGKIGLGGAHFVPHPDYGKQWNLSYRRNVVQAGVAVLLWGMFVFYVAYQIFHATCDLHHMTNCITSQRMQTFPWDEVSGSSNTVVYIRSMQKHLSLKVQSCLVREGDYAGYKTNRLMNRIDPVKGGCAEPSFVNLSSENNLSTLVSDGGCKLFERDNAYRSGWCYKISSPVLGQFGDPAYRFLKIMVVADAKELIAAKNYTNLDFLFPKVLSDGTERWNSVYYTFDPFYPMKKEVFFERVDLVKHSSLEFRSSSAAKFQSTFLQYHHEYNRWDTTDSARLRAGLSSEDTLTVATLYLRATTSRIVYEERQVKTLYDLPKDVGGFWTATLFFAATCYFVLQCSYPHKVVGLSEIMQREDRKHPTLSKQDVEMMKSVWSKLSGATDRLGCNPSDSLKDDGELSFDGYDLEQASTGEPHSPYDFDQAPTTEAFEEQTTNACLSECGDRKPIEQIHL